MVGGTEQISGLAAWSMVILPWGRVVATEVVVNSGGCGGVMLRRPTLASGGKRKKVGKKGGSLERAQGFGGNARVARV